MPDIRGREQCNATSHALRNAGLDVTSDFQCSLVPTHEWVGYYLCSNHADVYNSAFPRNGVNYQPIGTLPVNSAPSMDEPLIRAEHSGVITNVVCTNCEAPIHRCAYHNNFGCNRMGTDARCVLCTSCQRSLFHRHCLECRAVVNDGWLCEGCASCGLCRPMSAFDTDLCSGCYDEQRSRDNEREESQEDNQDDGPRAIYGYHEYKLPKARPVMEHSLHHGKPFLWMGVECETEVYGGDGDRYDIARAINAKYSESVVLSDDCTLINGIEIITAPLSISEQVTLWKELAPFAVKQGLRSWSYDTTGMHVHVSRNFFSQLEIGKLLVFLNSKRTYEPIRKLAGRDSGQYTKFLPKKLKDGMETGYARYEALNTSNERTLEFRIFKGTLSTAHILANIEFVHALCMYVKQASIRNFEDWPFFWMYVKKNQSMYRHLIEFFELEVEQAA